MGIFIIDDTAEELQKAHDALERVGIQDVAGGMSNPMRLSSHFGNMGETGTNKCDPAFIYERLDLLKNFTDGIITDLMFNPGNERYWNQSDEFPSGVGIVMWAMKNNVPIVVCTTSKHEKLADWAKVVLRQFDIPIENGKDWDRAVELLQKEIGRRNG